MNLAFMHNIMLYCKSYKSHVFLADKSALNKEIYMYKVTKEVKKMKENIHPKYGEAVVKCACGETFVTGSTKEELRVEICSKCHPFFTGKQKLVDTGGRVERFMKRYGMANEK